MGKAIFEIPILYGSQTGNAEAAAIELASLLPKELSSPTLRIISRATHLDDFLEHGAKWTPLFVIITSSYGVGQAPIGCHKFRELCDHILTQKSGEDDALIEGCNYAILGLGDSKFTTFFLNPTVIDSALSKAGAIRLGKLGKADASGTGENVQSKIIDEWCNAILLDLKFALKDKNSLVGKSIGMLGKDEEELANKSLNAMQQNTLNICSNLFEDWQVNEPKETDRRVFSVYMLLLPIVVGIVVTFLFGK